MQRLFTTHNVYIDHSEISGAGRGVFAAINLKKDDVVETCPYIELSENDPANLKGSKLVTYFIYFGRKKAKIAIMLGYGSLYNHSQSPNSTFKIDSKRKTISFIATENIKKGEEITFNYKGYPNPSDSPPLWFEK